VYGWTGGAVVTKTGGADFVVFVGNKIMEEVGSLFIGFDFLFNTPKNLDPFLLIRVVLFLLCLVALVELEVLIVVVLVVFEVLVLLVFTVSLKSYYQLHRIYLTN
jgi:hypothetical protein